METAGRFASRLAVRLVLETWHRFMPRVSRGPCGSCSKRGPQRHAEKPLGSAQREAANRLCARGKEGIGLARMRQAGIVRQVNPTPTLQRSNGSSRAMGTFLSSARQSIGLSAATKSGWAFQGPLWPSFSVSTGSVAGAAAERRSRSADAWLWAENPVFRSAPSGSSDNQVAAAWLS